MKPQRKSAAAILVLVLVLFATTKNLLNVKSSMVTSQTGPVIDVYTQKLPYNGVGVNQSSDAFRPDEKVILYAKVTYNEYPVQNQSVSFIVSGPVNHIKNFSFIFSSVTNASGIAKTNFRIPNPSENLEETVFGEWKVLGITQLADKVTVDVLTFLVGWIVEISKLQILNGNLKPETRFPKGSEMNVNLTMENIAFTSKNVTLTLIITDANNIAVVLISKINEASPGKTLILIEIQIPCTAAIGQATLVVNLFVLPDSFYPPQTNENFSITLLGDLNGDGTVNIKDVAIVSLAFGSDPTHPRWNPIADVDGNCKVDIKDVALVASNFGKVDP